METVRIGCVEYLNTLPLIQGLASWRDVEVLTDVPSKLFGMLVDGGVDVALASVIDAAKLGGAGDVVLLPAGMIGCDGATLTVRLFSRRPIGELESIAVDTDSHTSAVLLQVLMHRLHGRRVRVVDFDARSAGGRWPEAVLLIGDKVVTDAPPAAEYPFQMDLGEAWKRLTGLPFVYAAWMCRAGEEESVSVRAATIMLDRARRHNATRLDWIINQHAGAKRWPADLARRYVGEYLHYHVGEAEREAAAKFLRFAAELGLCRPIEPVWAQG